MLQVLQRRITMGKFDDIINREYVKSPTRRHMTMVERAAQFGAFKAVVGHEDALHETARLTDGKMELDEYTKVELNEKLQRIATTGEIEEVSITYFVPDEKKTGGAYITKIGVATKVREYERDVIMDDGTEITIDDIIVIEGNQFNEMESI